MSVTDPAHLVVTDPAHPIIPGTAPIVSPQHWSQRSGVMASPTMTPVQQTPRDFLLNMVNEEEMGNLPPFNHHVINCPCSPDCKNECCCRMRRHRRSDSLEADASTRLLPERTNGDNRPLSVSSYGSTDSNDNLIQRSEDMTCQSPSGGPSFVVHTRRPPVEENVRCGCHEKVTDNTTRKAKIKLVIACLVALVFMLGEVVGGYLAGSLAIMTDAAHMLSDFAGFLISLFAIWVASRPPSKRMSFGWHRAEVVGAVVSVLIIWVLTGVLVYEAVLRVIHQTFEVDANIMLITACVGVFVNVLMCAVLHQHSHGHGGGHGHRHGNSHRHGDGSGSKEMEDSAAAKSSKHKKKARKSDQNINVRAAFIHVIGDLIQSIGVVIAGYIIWFKPDWKLADPICTFLFSILVLISTLNVMRDALRVLMEGTPKHINYEAVKEDLEEIDGVKQAHSLHIWSLTLNKIALAAHLVIEPGANNQQVLTQASHMLKERYNIHQTTLQVEDFHPTMDECGTCQKPSDNKSKLLSCWP